MLKTVPIFFVIAGLCGAQQLGSIEGRITNQAGEPLKSAVVRVRPSAGPRNRGNPAVETGGDGSFLLNDVPPGRYLLYADRLGYSQEEYGSLITLNPGQKLTGVSLKLTRAALIAGKVVDQDGDPVPNARVIAFRGTTHDETYINGNATTRADGSFVIGDLSADSYFLSAEVQTNQNSGSRDVSTGPQEDFMTTYYPEALEASKAARIPVEAGAEVRDLEIRMKKIRLYHVSGKVILSSTGAPVSNAAVSLQSNHLVPPTIASMGTPVDGTFQFTHIPPGEYTLREYKGGSGTADFVGSRLVIIAGSDVNDAILNVSPALEITGKITLDGPGTLAQTHLELMEDLEVGILRRPTLESKDDGTFTVRNLEPGMYRLRVEPLPANTYVKSIHLGNQDATRGELDLTQGTGGSTLEILLSRHAAEVSGSVRNSKGEIRAGVYVSLQRTGFPRTTTKTDQNGAFEFGNLAPGEYRLVTLGKDFPDDLTKFDNQAATIKLSEDSHQKIDPLPITENSPPPAAK